MKELEKTKGKEIEVPVRATRYIGLTFSKAQGWVIASNLDATPEGAYLQATSTRRYYKEDDDYYPMYFKVVEVELNIPIP